MVAHTTGEYPLKKHSPGGGNPLRGRTNQVYNSYNQLTRQSWQMGSTAYSESFTYNSSDGSLNTMTTASGNTLTMGYDGLRRLSTVTGGPFNRSYTYRDISSTKTTTQVSQLGYPNLGSGLTFGYTYDARGNIASYAAPGEGTVTYTYDNQGQLLKAQGGTNYTYTYDTVGNLLTASDGTTAHTYTYGNTDWKDLLTAFDGQSITYDTSGNPTSYYNGTRWTMGWVNGRQLSTAQSSAVDLSFTYGIDGLRTGKAVGGISHSYLYAGGKLLRESCSGKTLDFIYDANGTPYALKYNGTVYYYVTNLQGDVVRLVDSGKNTVASYQYDPYGKVLSATGTMAEINPLRYRGYYYDSETGFYYLQSRYYDPAVGRFINADSYASTGQGIIGNNMFAYCGNNPVNLVDGQGGEPEEAIDTDGDGENDCYVYTYTYRVGLLWWENNQIGKVYIYTNVLNEDAFKELTLPDGFNPSSDLLVGDWTSNENPTMYAYQAQNVKAKYREQIVDILFRYTLDFDKSWKRTKSSVMVEWREHHRYHRFSERAQNIDFDEAEEGKGTWYFLKKAIGAALN